jgi:hypothetical protein
LFSLATGAAVAVTVDVCILMIRTYADCPPR